MKQLTSILFFLLFTLSGTYAQIHPEKWETIQELDRQNLPKSALEKVNNIYQEALYEQNSTEIIKALLYRERYHVELEEDGYVKSINNIEDELKKPLPLATKLILKSILAEMYANYLDNNRYKIENRTTIKDDNSSDVLTWSMDRLANTSSLLYLDSLQEEAKKIPIERFKALLQGSNNQELRPTLYDFLAFRALRHFKNERYYLTQPANHFYIYQTEAFGKIETFISHKFKTKETTSFKYQTLLLYQKLLRFHLERKDKKALHYINFERLQFVYNNFIGALKDKLYLKTLNYLQAKYAQSEALYYLAKYYQNHQKFKKALRYANQGIKSQDKVLSSRCQIIKNSIESQSIEMYLESVNLPHENILAKINYKNIEKVYIKVFKVTKEEMETIKYLGKYNPSNYQLVDELNISLPSTDDYKRHSTEINLGGYGFGEYIFMVAKEKMFKDRPLFVHSTISNISYIKRGDTFVMIDRSSGEPMEGVKAECYQINYDNKSRKLSRKDIAIVISNREGFLKVPKRESEYKISFSKGEDRVTPMASYYSYSRDREDKNEYKSVHFFTDRAIYRPSQTIYFKGLAIRTKRTEKPKILASTKVQVSFYNTNHEKIETKSFLTNEYGTFNGSFTAPKSGLLGLMSIQANIGGATQFRVEEYKRPKFEVTFKPLSKSYRLGERVTLKGEAKAYSGYGLDGAMVKYSVYRRASFPWFNWWQKRPTSHNMQITQGEVKCNQDGTFKISFDAINDKSISIDKKAEFAYEVSVDVTDSTGETQSNQKTINIGYVAINAKMIIEPELNLNTPKELKLKTTNLNGEFQPLKGEIIIKKLEKEKRVYRKRYWGKVDKPLYREEEFSKLFKHYRYRKREPKNSMVRSISFDTQISKTVTLENLEQGEYLLTLYTKDRYGTEVKKSQKIIVYDSTSSKPPIMTNLWIKTDKDAYEVGSTATLHLKSSLPNSFVMLTIQEKGKITEEKWIKLDEINQELINITKASQGNINYQLNMIKNNRLINRFGIIKVPWDNRLNVEFITFRDKLKPNSQEEWKIKISGRDKEKVTAEMVATMYDASLDKFSTPMFSKPTIYPHYGFNYRNRWSSGEFTQTMNSSQWHTYEQESKREFYQLNWFGLSMFGGYGGRRNLMESKRMVSYMATPSAPMAMAIQEESTGRGGDIAVAVFDNQESDKEEEKKRTSTIHIRENLKETMFFKPQLQTDKEGNIIIHFKTNDALTRWNFLGFIHTKNLQMGLIKKEIVTQKKLMVVTNLPRFFREKDSIELSAKIVNMSNQALKGVCELKLINPLTQKPIYGDHNFSKPFKIEKGASTAISFTIKVPDVDKIPAIQHTIIAKTHNHTDAEQVTKPILSNRLFITESKPLHIKAKEERTFTLKSLKENNSTTLKNHKLTLEFTSNPVWYAIRSLPYLMEYPHECSEQLFSRYYANAIASKVANSSPKIRKVFQSWKNKKQLKSALSSNQELKTILLEETPWVLNAQSEEEQLENMGLLFDIVKLGESQQIAHKKLMKRQASDGGWAWFTGGESNLFITQHIIEGFGRLKNMGIRSEDKATEKAIKRAISFIDKKLQKRYDRLLKEVEDNRTKLEDNHLDSMVIHYLYSRSFYPFKVDKALKIAQNYYINQAKKYWTSKGLYEQAMLALTLDKPDALTIIKSLKERALIDDELGMYFKYNNGFYWNEMPIETHTLMIEVFDTIAKDKKSVELLKIWLLKNRQTTHWKTTKATASAIYALLRSDKWINSDKLVDISFNTPINYQPILEKAKEKAQKGTGYFKASFNMFDRSMATVKVKNPNNSIAWGSLYWQYFEELDKIKTFKETPLSIDKKLFLVQDTKMGKKLTAIEKQALKVGDKIKVHIEIKVDRDMEYIMLKDSRASAFEPLNVLSQYRWQDGLGYYESTKDNATYFFMDYLKRGTYIFEYPLMVTHRGSFSNGVTTIESMYAPEFKSHSKGIRIRVK